MKRLKKYMEQHITLKKIKEGYEQSALINICIANEFVTVDELQYQDYEQFLQELKENWLLKEEKSIMLT